MIHPGVLNAITEASGTRSTFPGVKVNYTSPWGLTASSHSGTTVSITLEEVEDSEETVVAWEGILALEGAPTGDLRYLMPGDIGERDYPLPFMVQTINDEGHKGSELGGRIDFIEHIPIAEFDKEGFDLGDLPDSAIVIWATGSFDDSEAGQNGVRVIDNGGGVSVDMSVTEVLFLDPETYEPIDPEELDLATILFGGGDFVTGIKGQIMGATVLPFPAFEEAEIQVVTASGNENVLTLKAPFAPRITRRVSVYLTASAAGKAPVAPPREWFEMPEPDLPTALTVTEDGRVYGHLALWGQCHTGYKDYCQTPPRSRNDYKFFHLGEILTDDGEHLSVGKITVGTGHAPISYGSVKTLEHYDNTGCVAAFVRAKDGKWGIWLSGAVRSDLPVEKIRDLTANPPSGDWRIERGALELQTILAVPVPGFPVPRSEARLVASGEVEELEALISSGYAPSWPKKKRRKRKMLSARLHEALKEIAVSTE